MIIVSDIDNCLNNLTEKAVELYNARSGKNIQLSDLITYKFGECLSQEDSDGLCALFKERELWDSLSPTEGSYNALKTIITNGHEVYLATATDPVNFAWKCEWIQKHFDFFPIKNIIRIHDKHLLQCDVMIDDCIENLTDSFCERIIFNHPWNKNNKDSLYNLRRVYNWNDIISTIDTISGEVEEWEIK